MKFTFWQNIISIHQSAFIKVLAEEHHVILVAEQSIEIDRKSQGWNVPEMDKVKIVTNPDRHEISCLLVNDTIHVFSGINVYPMVKYAFKSAVKKKLKVGVNLEPFRPDGLKGFFRTFKYIFLSIKYGKSIDFLLATGELACKEYQNAGFSAEKIFNWAYYIESFNNSESKPALAIAALPNILFVGSLDKRKNIIQLVNTCIKHSDHFNELIIIGDGPLKKDVLLRISNHPNIRYLGNLSNAEVRSMMTKSDLLVLPSLFDGWGAVVNEALHSGMQVIASENCGASVLLDGDIWGEKFYFKGKNDLETVLLRWLGKGPVSTERRQEIKTWSQNHISGEVAASYFNKIMAFIYGESTTKPIAPWKENS